MRPRHEITYRGRAISNPLVLVAARVVLLLGLILMVAQLAIVVAVIVPLDLTARCLGRPGFVNWKR